MKTIKLDRDYYVLQRELYDWCVEQFGQPYSIKQEGTWGVNFAFGYQTFNFADDAEATLFTLRWV
jgi:hypothetical protein